MATTMTSNMQQVIPHTSPPVLGGTEARAAVDELMGVPYADPNWVPQGYWEQGQFKMSVNQLMFGENKTNLGELVVLQQLLRDNFYTTVFAPIEVMPNGVSLDVKLDQITFKPILPQLTPEEGRSRIASWEFNTEQQTLQREALSAEFGHEFLYDPNGAAIARKVMDQLYNGIEEGLKFGVMWAYQHVPDMAIARELKNAESKMAQWGPKQIDAMFERTKRYFGIFQIELKAVAIVDNLLTEEMGQYGGQADSYLIPFALAHYVTVINPFYTTFITGGEAAVRRLERGVDAFGTWGSSKVYIVRSYDTSRKTGPVDLLRRRYILSEYYVGFDHLRKLKFNEKQYDTSLRSIQVMNGDRDTRATIPLRDGLRNTGRWDDNGKLISLNDPLMNRFEVELSPEESGDSLHWTDADGRQNICTHFGQIARAYLSTQTFMTMAKTLLAHSDELERCCNDRDMPLNQALRTLRDAASDMRKIPHDRTAEEFLILVAQKNRAGNRGQRHDRQTGCPTINSSTLDWVPDARTGGLLLPTRSGAPAEAVGAAADAIAAKALVVRLTGDANTQDPVIAGNNIVHPDFPTGSLTTAGSYNRFARVAGIYTDLMPFFNTAPGFRAIQEAVRASGNNATNFASEYGGYNFAKAADIAAAVTTITRALPALKERLPNAIFLDGNYASSYFHNPDEFTTLVENIISPTGVPLFLRRHTVVAASAASRGGAAGGAAVAAPSEAEIQRALDNLTGLTTEAVNVLAKQFTGRLDLVANLARRYSTAARPTTLIGANLTNAGAGGVALDPMQEGASAPQLADAAAVVAATPPLSRARWTAGAPALVEGLARVYVAEPDAAAPEDVKAVFSAYNSLLRLLFQYRPSLPVNFNEQTARSYVKEEGLRTVLLSLVSLVNTGAVRGASAAENTAAVARRLRQIFVGLIDTIASQLNNETTTSPSVVNFGEDAVLAAAERFYSNAETKGLKVFGPDRTLDVVQSVVRSVFANTARVEQDIGQLFRRPAFGGVAGDTAFIAEASRMDPTDYLRAPLLGSDRQLESYVGDAGRAPGVGISTTPMALYGNPLNKEVPLSTLDMHKYARDIRGGAAVPPALASDGSLLNANQLPASSNVLALRNARLLPNLSGTLSPADYADSVRRSETFNQPPASRGIQVESSLAVEEDMEVTTPNVPAFQAPSSAVGRGIGSLGCIRNDVDYLFSAGTFQEHWTELRKQLKTNVAVATVALLIASTPTDWQNITAFLEGNVTVPFTVLYTRPLIVFHTYTIYKVKAGRDTAVTYIARPMTNWGDDPIRQQYVLQMSFYSKTIIKNKRNVQSLPNVFLCGLERGYGMSFFTRDTFAKTSNEPDNADSLIALLEPYEPYLEGELPSVFPLTGKFQNARFSYDASKERDNYKSLFHNKLCYFNVKWAQLFWGFYHKSKAEVSREADRISAVGSNPRFEFFAWQGQTLYPNPNDGRFTFKRASAFIADRVCGPGMIKTIKDSTQEFPRQDFSVFTDI